MTRDRLDPPLLAVPLLRGGTFEIRPSEIRAADKPYALSDLASVRLISDSAIIVPPDAPPWPAVEITLRDGRLILLTPTDPQDGWIMLEELFRAAPALWIPLPPRPSRAEWRGGSSSVPGAGYAPAGIFGAPDEVEAGSTDAVLAGIAHLSLFFAPIVLPLIIWLTARERSHYAARQAKQALAFQAIYALAALVVVVAWFVIAFDIAATSTQGTVPLGILIGFGVFFVLFVVLALFEILFSIYGAVQTFRGRPFSYPFLRRL
jgi:uncharacterized Tic20 family protein